MIVALPGLFSYFFSYVIFFFVIGYSSALLPFVSREGCASGYVTVAFPVGPYMQKGNFYIIFIFQQICKQNKLYYTVGYHYSVDQQVIKNVEIHFFVHFVK